MGATGVCRSDWHAWKGHDPVVLPHIGGHEFAGVVVAAGSGVTGWRAGDRVTVPFACGCGSCEHCLAGDAQVCPRQTQPGFTGPGSFAELVAVHAADANLVALPADVDFVTAACLGCRFATAFRAVTAHGRVRPGDWLAVHGCGGVGLSAVMIGAALGARVLAVDVSAAALARARELGAEAAVARGRRGRRPRGPGRRDRGAHRRRGARLDRRARLAGRGRGLGALPAPPRTARPGRPAAGRPRTAPDGPGHRARAGDLRLARHGRPRLPGHDAAGRGRHAAPRAAGGRGDRARRTWGGPWPRWTVPPEPG